MKHPTRQLRVVLFLLPLIITAGCDAEKSVTDGGAADTTKPTPDGPQGNDLATDAGTADGAPADGAQNDANKTDANAEDSALKDSAPLSDMASDIRADRSGLGACASSAYGIASDDPEMTACIGPATGINQCEAASYCTAGWQLCTASRYFTAHKKKELPAAITESLWIAGCVRSGGTPHLPKDTVCSDCSSTTGADAIVGWSCVNPATLQTDQLHVGLRTSSACSRTGTNSDASTAFWQAWPATRTLAGALCCKTP